MPSSPLALSFRLFQNDQLIREETLTQAVIKIGKVPSAHLQIADDAVSRMHAIIEVTGREVSLIDLGSTRGTFVNGKRVNKARLESGDAITLGDTRIEFAIRDASTGPDAAAEPAAAEPARVLAASSATPAPVRSLPPVPPPLRAATSTTPALRGSAIAPPAVPASTLPLRLAAALVEHEQHDAVRAGDAGPLSVEVAAMLGDSVVDVKHCLDPRGGKVSAATWSIVAGGAACLVASAIAFGLSIHTAAANHARLDAWTRVEHKPAYAFRPRRLGYGVDAVAFGGLGLALVGLGLGLSRARRERTSPYYRIGTAPGVDLAIEHAPAPAFPLVAPSGDDFVFNFVAGTGAGIDGELLEGAAATPLAALAAAGRARPSATIAGALEVPIARHARIRARAGGATVLISAVARPRRHTAPLLARIDRRTLGYVAGSLAAHLAVLAFLQLVPPDPTGINSDLGSVEQVTGHVVGVANLPPPPPPPDRGEHGSDGGAPGSKAMALPSGASGDPAAIDRGRQRLADAHQLPSPSRADEIERARNAGLLGDRLVTTAIADLSRDIDLASGFAAETTVGAIAGEYGNGPGNFGGGLTGFGAGGGCTDEPCGLIPSNGDGHGRYATIGRGPAAGDDYGLPGGHGFGPRGHRPQLPVIGTPVVSAGAGYDKTIIRRYIRRNIDKIGYCYDRQLLAHPGIGGDIVASFFIAPTGAVQTASATGFDAEVASCVAGVLRSIEFPRPGDGVGVQVNYPLQFHAPG